MWFIFGRNSWKRKRMSKCIGKWYEYWYKCIDISSVFLLVTSQCVTVSSFVSAINTPLGIITMLVTLFFALSNGFVELFLPL